MGQAYPKINLLLDNIRSAHNVGSIFRTADGFGVQHLYLCGITSTPPNKEIRKAALDAEMAVPWSYHNSTAELLSELKAKGYRIIAVEQSNRSIQLQHYVLPQCENIVLLVGNEVDGVEDEILHLCDDIIEIPQFGIKKSFNVSIAAGIALWHCVQQRL